MFKAIRIGILLFILFFVAVNTWLTQARSTDWNNSLWVKIYPINADGSETSDRYIEASIAMISRTLRPLSSVRPINTTRRSVGHYVLS